MEIRSRRTRTRRLGVTRRRLPVNAPMRARRIDPSTEFRVPDDDGGDDSERCTQRSARRPAVVRQWRNRQTIPYMGCARRYSEWPTRHTGCGHWCPRTSTYDTRPTWLRRPLSHRPPIMCLSLFRARRRREPPLASASRPNARCWMQWRFVIWKTDHCSPRFVYNDRQGWNLLKFSGRGGVRERELTFLIFKVSSYETSDNAHVTYIHVY